MKWFNDRANSIANLASSLTAILSVACGGIALAHGDSNLVASLGMLGGLFSAIAVLATGAASKARDEQLELALYLSTSSHQRQDATGLPQF
jgi:hypothetical protein